MDLIRGGRSGRLGGFVMVERAHVVGGLGWSRRVGRLNGPIQRNMRNRRQKPDRATRRYGEREGGNRVGFCAPNTKRPHRSGYAKPPTWSEQVAEKEERATGEAMGDSV